jgi:hypothetical protein
VAIHNRALTPAQIQQNFDAGVGEKYYMLFNVSHLVSVPQAYVMLEAAQLDSYGLQFSKPTFISLDKTATVSNLPIAGIRIGVNGAEAGQGQAYIPLSATIGAGYTSDAGQKMTDIGTVIGLQKGVLDDLFFLSFDTIGTNSHPHPDPTVPTPLPPVDSPPQSDVGLRTFDGINATLSKLTGVSTTNSQVSQTYGLVQQALPAVDELGTFGPAQQTGMAQLAIVYCNQLVDTPNLRTAFFSGGMNPSSPGSAFGASGSAARESLIGDLLTKGKNTGLEFDPDDSAIHDELDSLINKLLAGPTGSASGGAGTVMKATCGAVIGSGITLIR